MRARERERENVEFQRAHTSRTIFALILVVTNVLAGVGGKANVQNYIFFFARFSFLFLIRALFLHHIVLMVPFAQPFLIFFSSSSTIAFCCLVFGAKIFSVCACVCENVRKLNGCAAVNEENGKSEEKEKERERGKRWWWVCFGCQKTKSIHKTVTMRTCVCVCVDALARAHTFSLSRSLAH